MSGVRPAGEGDVPALKRLWTAVFGDGEDFLSLFFAALWPSARALAAEDGEGLAGAAYLLDCFTLVTAEGRERPCPYLYAVAVAEERRGRGLGQALSLAAAGLCREAGQLCCLVPASESLFAFYERCAFRPAFSVCEGEAAAEGDCALTPLSPAAYLKEREARLSGRGHLRPSPAAMTFWAGCLLPAGGFYRLTLPEGETALAAVEGGDIPFAKELLCAPGREAAFSAALAAQLSAPSCRWRSPPGGAGTERPFGMLSEPLPAPLYLGPAFD